MSQESVRKKSLSGIFHRAMLIIYLSSIILVVPLIYFSTKTELYAQAESQLKLMVDVVRSARAIVSKKTRPHFLPKGEFFSPVVSSTVMAKELASNLHELQPQYLIRMVSDNPLNKENTPQGLEVEVLETLRRTSTKDVIKLSGEIDGRQYLISAAPTRVKDGCLICHGNPKNAPSEITNQYGTDSGYHWTPGMIVGATLVGVPLADINLAVLKRSGFVIGVITILFAGILVILNRIVVYKIIRPIMEITDAAQEISLGKSNLPLTSDREDEIGALTRSFELMRRSISIATKKLKKSMR